MRKIVIVSFVFSSVALIYFLLHNWSIENLIPEQKTVAAPMSPPQHIAGFDSAKRSQVQNAEVPSPSRSNAIITHTISTSSPSSEVAGTVPSGEPLRVNEEPSLNRESVGITDHPLGSWETTEINPDQHCAFSSRLPDQTVLAGLEPGIVFEVEKRMKAGALANDFIVHEGKLDQYGGIFFESKWSEWLKEPTEHPMVAKHIREDEEFVECRVVPRGNKKELRDLKPKRQLALSGVKPSIDVYGNIQPVEQALVFVFDLDEGVQTISCSPARNHSATELTVADFARAFGNRFDICAPAKTLAHRK